MREEQIGCLPVTEHGRLVGIITEGDLLSLLSEQLPPLIGATAGP
jgi:CBS domain-containing protein